MMCVCVCVCVSVWNLHLQENDMVDEEGMQKNLYWMWSQAENFGLEV
jgi:hypothetical protein